MRVGLAIRRKPPKRPILGRIDRLVFVGLHRLAPDVLSAFPGGHRGSHRREYDQVLARESDQCEHKPLELRAAPVPQLIVGILQRPLKHYLYLGVARAPSRNCIQSGICECGLILSHFDEAHFDQLPEVGFIDRGQLPTLRSDVAQGPTQIYGLPEVEIGQGIFGLCHLR